MHGIFSPTKAPYPDPYKSDGEEKAQATDDFLLRKGRREKGRSFQKDFFENGEKGFVVLEPEMVETHEVDGQM